MAIGRRRRGTVVVAAALMLAATVSCSSAKDESSSSSGESPTPTSAAEAQPKADFTNVTPEMFVGRTAVPNGLALAFTPPEISTDVPPNDPVTPPECGPIFFGPTPTQYGSIGWQTPPSDTGTGSGYKLFLIVPAERPDIKSLVGKCSTIEHQGSTVNVAALPLQGVPDWATATRTTTDGADGATIIGLFRGLYISVTFSQTPAGDLAVGDSDGLVRLFYEQVKKLEAM